MKNLRSARSKRWLGFFAPLSLYDARSRFFRDKASFKGLQPSGWRAKASVVLTGFILFSVLAAGLLSLTQDAQAIMEVSRPDGDVTKTFATCAGTGCAANHYTAVDEDPLDNADYVSTGTGMDSALAEEEYTMSSVAGPDSNVTQVVVKFQAQSVTVGSTADTVSVRIFIDGAYYSLAQPITMPTISTLRTATFTGNWTGDEDLQVEFVRNVVGSGGNARGHDDDARIYQVYADVTYTPPPDPWTTITQRHGVITNDQNNTVLSGHTAKIGERLRVISQVDTSSGNISKNLALKLQYDKNDNNWNDVTPAAEIRPAESPHFNEAALLHTGVAGACNTGAAIKQGYVFERTGISESAAVESLSCRDVGFVIDTANATNNTVYRFRLFDVTNGTALNAYSEYASFTTQAETAETIHAAATTTPVLSNKDFDLFRLLDNDGYSNISQDDDNREIIENTPSNPSSDDVSHQLVGSTNFGITADLAGDVNGDGYEDIVAGTAAPTALGAFVYYGGPSSDTIPDVTLNISVVTGSTAIPVASAGDVNNDGYDDVIVGTPHYDEGALTNPGKAYIFFGGSTMDGIADVVITGTVSSMGLGDAVDTAGDVNNDGYDDVIVGGETFDIATGVVYIFLGGSTMDATADLTISGSAAQQNFGSAVAAAGDVNNDGFADVIVGENGYDGAAANNGRAYIYYGGSPMNTTADVTITGTNQNDALGTAVAAAGDVNNDGHDDVIVGVYGYDLGTNTNEGRSYIYHGGASMDNVADITLSGSVLNGYFGNSVSSAGDINNDGYADVIVGAWGFASVDATIGSAHIYLGGSAMDTTADLTIIGEAEDHNLGQAISTVNDFNNDGYADFIVSARGYNVFGGRVSLYYGGATLDNTADLVFDGSDGQNLLGESVANAGDVNGDGFDDVIVGAQEGAERKGRAHIFFGSASPDATIDITLIGETIGDNFGTSVASAGDVNNDGYDDVIVGAETAAAGIGRAYVYFGGTSMNAAADVVMTGVLSGDRYGTSVASAGDVNNDGYDDVIVGADGFDVGTSTNEGRSYIYHGGTSMNDIADVTLTGESTSSFFGVSVDSAGDVNNDGFSDVIIGAEGFDGFATNIGKAYIFLGGSSMDTASDVQMTGTVGNSYYASTVSSAGDVNGDGYGDVVIGHYNEETVHIYLGGGTMDNDIDTTLTSADLRFGTSASSAGDVNGDGYSDIVIGTDGYSVGSNTNEGRAYVYLGGSAMTTTPYKIYTGEEAESDMGLSVSSAGDFNGDGYDDVVVGSPGWKNDGGRIDIFHQGPNIPSIDAVTDAIFTGEATNNYYASAIASAGDVNGDGYDDVIVGASRNTSSTGKAYIYFGGVNGDFVADVTLAGAAIGNNFGSSVSSAGDVNGDGYDDVIVGAYNFDVGSGTNEGRAYIFYGGASMDSVADVPITGAVGEFLGTDVGSSGDINGDGFDDVVVGAPGHNASTGRVYVYFGGSGMNNTADATITGEATGNSFGNKVASAGDVNGDGYGDIIASSHQYAAQTGRSYMFFGSDSISGSLAASTASVVMTGEAASSAFGSAISSAGDVNGDGYGDVVVGANNYDVGSATNDGRAYLYYGGATMDATADVVMTGEGSSHFHGGAVSGGGDANGDGYSDIVIGALGYSSQTGRAYVYYGGPTMNNAIDVTMSGEAANTRFGQALSFAGDMNGDGFDDVMAGAEQYSSFTGRGYLYLGGVDDAYSVVPLAQKHTAACSSLSSIDASWNGQSNVAAVSNNLVMQVFRFGATNAWETATTNSALAASVDGTITGSKSTNVSEYCDGSNWSYWRVYQDSGQQTLQTDAFSVNFTVGGTNTPPAVPANLAQVRVTAGTTIATGGWSNESQVKFAAQATDPDASDTLELCVEAKLIANAFDGTGKVCGTPVAYSGSAVPIEVTVTGLVDGQYHWRAEVKDAAGEYSTRTNYGGNAETFRDFGIDTVAPTGTIYDGPTSSVDASFNNGTLTTLGASWTIDTTTSGLSGNEYSIGTTPGGADTFGWTSFGGSRVTVSSLSLTTSKMYYFNIRSTDNAGNVAIISSDGQIVAPTLTFTTSINSIDFSALNAGNNYTASQAITLTTATNALNGYKVYGKANDVLKSPSLETVGMFSGGSYATPAAWGAGLGFGYTSSDTNVGGTNRFNIATCLGGGSAPCFAPYSLVGLGDVIADNSGVAPGGPAINDSVTITSKVSVDSAAQKAGKYQTTVLYSAYATY